ncbi:MAG: hypothetical protein LBG16_00180 [Elusimicrobiota bacterium]|jgi:hypothetical protein|nr:hypothetical protein [Elusimicrobiota bacterium]
MKYWYLKGGDALGPMEPAEIVKDKDFTLDALVCPRDESEREEAWRSPKDYIQDFGPFIKAAAEPAGDKPAQVTKLMEEISPEETIHSRSPLTAPLENNLLDDLPAKAPLSGAAPARAAADAQPVERYSSMPQSPADTFTAANAVVLKSGGGEGFSPAPEPIVYTPQPATAAPRQLQTLQPALQPAQEAVAINIFDKQTLTPDHSASAGKPQHNTMPMGSMTLPTTNGKIINTIDPRRSVESGKKNDTLYVLIFVMFIVIVVALFMAFFYKEDTPPAKPAEQTSAVRQPQQKAPLQGLSEEVLSPAAAAQGAAHAQEAPPPSEAIKTPALTQQAGNITVAGDNAAATTIAMRMVKEYLLDERRGTIGEYLSKTYKDYRTTWAAQPLYNDSYTVNFHASKVRQEPVQYVFKINIKDRSIVGLNNVTIELLDFK